MKRITNIAVTMIALLTLGITSASARQAYDHPVVIGTPAVSVSPLSDSLSVSLAVSSPAVSLGRNQSLTVSFRIVGEGRDFSLPELVYTGTRRFRYTRRSEILSGTWRNAENRHTIIVKGKKAPAEYGYEVLIPAAEWLTGARLFAEYTYHDRCSDSVVGSDVLDFLWGAEAKPEMAAKAPGATVKSEVPAPVAAAEERGTAEVITAHEVPLVREPRKAVSIDSMVYVSRPQIQAGDIRTVTAVIYYINNETEMTPEMSGNRAGMETFRSALKQLPANSLPGSATVSVTGYASPEGYYSRNEGLARTRVQNCIEQLNRDKLLDGVSVSTRWVAEDWDGVVGYLEKEKPRMWNESLRIINGTGIFEGREKKLMELGRGDPYRHLLKEAFPPLRRVELRLEYRTDTTTPEEAEAKVLSGNGNPPLYEIFAAASRYGPADDRFMQIYRRAAGLYPDDPAVNNNLAAAYLCIGDTATAAVYLDRVGNLPEAYINKGVCRYLEGDTISARIYFTLAAKENIEPGTKNLLLIGNNK